MGEVETCLKCDGEITPELARSTKDGLRHHPRCPITVEFSPEVLCPKHRRVTEGSANCGEPPCSQRFYTIDGKRFIGEWDIRSVTDIAKEVSGDRFGVGKGWGEKIGREGKTTTKEISDTAKANGTLVHAIAEKWANEKKRVDPKDYPDDVAGLIRALYHFIEIEKPRPIEAEVRIGSLKGAYAGTYDLLALLPKIDSIGLLDYKTHTSPPKKKKPETYEQNHLQLRGYEEARIEMGMQPSDFQAVINLFPDGTYNMVQGLATAAQWQAALAAYRSLTALRSAIKQAA